MIFSRSTFGETPTTPSAKPMQPAPFGEADDAAQPPRWGLLAAAVLAALVTAAWIGSAFSAAQAAAPQTASAQPSGK